MPEWTPTRELRLRNEFRRQQRPQAQPGEPAMATPERGDHRLPGGLDRRPVAGRRFGGWISHSKDGAVCRLSDRHEVGPPDGQRLLQAGRDQGHCVPQISGQIDNFTPAPGDPGRRRATGSAAAAPQRLGAGDPADHQQYQQQRWPDPAQHADEDAQDPGERRIPCVEDPGVELEIGSRRRLGDGPGSGVAPPPRPRPRTSREESSRGAWRE